MREIFYSKHLPTKNTCAIRRDRYILWFINKSVRLLLSLSSYSINFCSACQTQTAYCNNKFRRFLKCHLSDIQSLVQQYLDKTQMTEL